MTDQDIIRAAVELADGWNIEENGTVRTSDGQNFCFTYVGKCWKDALAAQLVRQWLVRHTCTVYTKWHSDPMKTIEWLVDNWGTAP